jgi:tRNA modification GTPase
MLGRPGRTVEGHPELFVASDTHPAAGPFFRELTAAGRGAIAVIRVWGVGAIQAVGSAFRANSGLPLEQSTPGRLLLGRMGAGLGDEAVAVVLETAIPAVEIQCHGGTAAVGMVLESLERAGAQRGKRWELAGLD